MQGNGSDAGKRVLPVRRQMSLVTCHEDLRMIGQAQVGVDDGPALAIEFDSQALVDLGAPNAGGPEHGPGGDALFADLHPGFADLGDMASGPDLDTEAFEVAHGAAREPL